MGKNFAEHADNETAQTIIESDVWMGMGCHIKEGVHIHTGAIIGMGSVVTKDIPPYEIWGGVPAKLIRKRFSDEVTEMLLESAWWNWTEEKIKEYSDCFDDPMVFLQQLKTEDN